MHFAKVTRSRFNLWFIFLGLLFLAGCSSSSDSDDSGSCQAQCVTDRICSIFGTGCEVYTMCFNRGSSCNITSGGTNNIAPIANAGPDQDTIVGTSITLDSSASSDLNGDILGHQWILISSPAGNTASLVNATSSNPTFTPNVTGAYIFGVRVDDGTVQSNYLDMVRLSVQNSSIGSVFQSPLNLSAGTSPVSISTGDYNNDNRSDFALLNCNVGLQVFLSNAGSGFTPQNPVNIGGDCRELFSGDFNNDNNVDLFFDNNVNGGFIILWGDGSGNYSWVAQTPNLPQGQSLLEVGDFNNDGNLDLLASLKIGLEKDKTISIFLGDGTGAFTQSTTFTTESQSVHVSTSGDITGDGIDDFAFSTKSDEISIVPGDASNSFSVSTTLAITGLSQIKFADINKNNRPDLIAYIRGSSFTSGSTSSQNSELTGAHLEVYLDDGSGGFTFTGSHSVVNNVSDFKIADFNNDSNLDVLVLNTSFYSSLTDGTGSIFYGNGSGSFPTLNSFPITSSPAAGEATGYMAIGDTNLDSKLDIGLFNLNYGLTILIAKEP